MNGGRVWWCTWHAYLDLFDMIWHVCGVGETFEDVWWRAWQERTTWAGSGSWKTGKYSNISEAGRHGSLQEHNGASWTGAVRRRCSLSCCVALSIPYGEQQLPPCVRSFPERPDARLRLWARLVSVTRRVWGAQIVTFNVRGFLRLLLDASRRVI